MTNAYACKENTESALKAMEQRLEAAKLEIEKLGKLTTDKDDIIRELRTEVERLQTESSANGSEQQRQFKSGSNSKTINEPGPGGTPSEKETNIIVSSTQGLTDLQSSVLSPNSAQGGSSSSFMVLGKNSRDAHVSCNDTGKSQSLDFLSKGNGGVEDFQVLHHPQKQDEPSTVGVKESSNRPVVENIPTTPNRVSPLPHHLKGEQKSSNYSSVNDDYIQVFPESSQSGGSNFYVPSMDFRTGGGQSCTNSSRRGPMSMVIVGHPSIPSYQYVDVKTGDGEKNDGNNEKNEPVALDAMPLPTAGSSHHDLYSGTGARPKGLPLPVQPKRSVGEEECEGTEFKPPTSNLEGMLNAMVTIPSEDSHSYRINNAPMLSYGRQESLTQISALTSFGSTLPSQSPDKVNPESGKYNNLNMVRNNPQSHLQEKRAEEFVIVEEVPPLKPHTNPIIPQVQPNAEEIDIKESNAVLVAELESVRRKMTQLHQANKEWKDRWDVLQKQKEDEITHLLAEVKKQTYEKAGIRREYEHHITSLKEELKSMTKSKKDTENAYCVLIAGRSQEKELLEKLRQDYGSLHQEKRSLEVKLEALQRVPRPTEVSKTSSELETELAVVKRQVTLFMDDFNKEHQERLVVEKLLQKEMESHQSLETKLRKTHALLKSRDEDLRQKSKKASDLQYEVDDLKLKLEVEQRRASIYPSMDIVAESTRHGANVEVSFEPESLTTPGNTQNIAVRSQNLNVHASKPDKPDKWTCIACTFRNKTSHKKCDICGTPRTHTDSKFIELN